MHHWLNCPRLSLASLLVVAALWGEITMAGAPPKFPSELGQKRARFTCEAEKAASPTPCVEPTSTSPRPRNLLRPGVIGPAQSWAAG
ncbi:MAG: hypothetical protein CBC48_10445 [bacterium TMED88]|nr:MAG: hypothetical protein CBC48_10445 [bacterium TMED88]